MPLQSFGLLPLTVKASGAIAAQRLVDWGGKQAVLNSSTMGVARNAATDGEIVTVDSIGTAIAEAGAAITAGASLSAGADGRLYVLDGVTYTQIAAVSLPGASAAAAGDMLEVFILH